MSASRWRPSRFVPAALSHHEHAPSTCAQIAFRCCCAEHVCAAPSRGAGSEQGGHSGRDSKATAARGPSEHADRHQRASGRRATPKTSHQHHPLPISTQPQAARVRAPCASRGHEPPASCAHPLSRVIIVANFHGPSYRLTSARTDEPNLHSRRLNDGTVTVHHPSVRARPSPHIPHPACPLLVVLATTRCAFGLRGSASLPTIPRRQPQTLAASTPRWPCVLLR